MKYWYCFLLVTEGFLKRIKLGQSNRQENSLGWAHVPMSEMKTRVEFQSLVMWISLARLKLTLSPKTKENATRK